MSRPQLVGPIRTVQQHILEEQQRFAGSSGQFSWLLSGITIATKLIQAKVRRAGLTDIIGEQGNVNVQGEVQQKLDVYANEVLVHCLSARESIGVLASEENEQPMLVHGGSENAKYAVVFDPLDGSSNIDVNVSVGTTFSILRRPDGVSLSEPEKWVLQPGSATVAAGYVVYGSSTMLVYSVGSGVHGFTLDPSIGAYMLSHPNIRMPDQGQYYSVNEAYSDTFPERYQEYVQLLRTGGLGRKYGSRYIGSMVADFHRTLLKGGVFLYPPTKSNPDGKLRLLYEANPVAFLAEQAGGVAIDGKRRVLDIQPKSIHQRTPLVVGSRVEMAEFQRLFAEPETC
jgi:fructose-1,6-bisphosphatase I